MTDGRHAVAEDVSLELHKAVAERLLEDPALVDRARERVTGWLRDGSVARPYAEAWQAIPEDALVHLASGSRGSGPAVNRAQLEHVIRAAATIAGDTEMS